MKIKGIIPASLIDYPGEIACVVFLGGCNFRCPFCQNPEVVMNKGEDIAEEEFLEWLERNKKWVDGVCITGGEPTIHKDLPEFIEKIKSRGFRVKLDTNGSNPEMIETLIKRGLVDYIAMDVKNTFEKYSESCGVDVNIEAIKKSIELIKNFANHEFRTTVVPTLHEKEDILKIASMLQGAKVYYLQTFSPQKTLDEKFQKILPYPKEFMEKLAEECSKFVPTKVR
jgi:pyruvate formate lyase activating enzyme